MHKDGSSNEVRIYVGYESPSIIKYLKLWTRDLFTIRFVDCHFDESIFLTLREENKQLEKDISWNAYYHYLVLILRKIVWTWSLKDNSFAKYSKSVAKRIHWPKESN